jgi:hypothetical protein
VRPGSALGLQSKAAAESADEERWTNRMQIELHGKSCSCRGGSWVIVDTNTGSPCKGQGNDARVVLTLAEWKGLGKPASAEEHAEAVAREKGGDRREFHRYALELQVRLSRLPSWRKDGAPQQEDTKTEVIARGGALVRSRMAVEKGEVLQFEAGDFRTNAEVMYVSGGVGSLRLGLRFLDGLTPDSLIPPGAQPLP